MILLNSVFVALLNCGVVKCTTLIQSNGKGEPALCDNESLLRNEWGSGGDDKLCAPTLSCYYYSVDGNGWMNELKEKQATSCSLFAIKCVQELHVTSTGSGDKCSKVVVIIIISGSCIRFPPVAFCNGTGECVSK